MKKHFLAIVGAFAAGVMAGPAHATLIGVSGPTSSLGTAPSIIAAPSDVLDDFTTNTGMQGFNEAQGVVTTVPHAIDGGGFIAAGTLVDSHMIFLNSSGSTVLTHFLVDWTFDGTILGIMSDKAGDFEAASTFELGNSATNYTTTFSGSGAAAPFSLRGLDSNNGTGDGGDGYLVLDDFTLRIGMYVAEPGDWIRVVTASSVSVPVPEPATLTLFGFGLAGLGAMTRRRKIV